MYSFKAYVAIVEDIIRTKGKDPYRVLGANKILLLHRHHITSPNAFHDADSADINAAKHQLSVAAKKVGSLKSVVSQSRDCRLIDATWDNTARSGEIIVGVDFNVDSVQAFEAEYRRRIEHR